MWFLRRMMKISWMAKKSNDTVLKEAHTSRALVNKIRTRQTTFFGHVMRREKLEHLITTGMMEGKRSRGKQREKMTDGLANWLGAGKVVEILSESNEGPWNMEGHDRQRYKAWHRMMMMTKGWKANYPDRHNLQIEKAELMT